MQFDTIGVGGRGGERERKKEDMQLKDVRQLSYL